MKEIIKKPIVVFLGLVFFFCLIFILFPINLFDGVIEYVEPHRSYKIEAPLSLSYFFGLGYDESDMVYVKDFYLTFKGWSTAAIFIVGIPALIGYKMHLTDKK